MVNVGKYTYHMDPMGLSSNQNPCIGDDTTQFFFRDLKKPVIKDPY